MDTKQKRLQRRLGVLLYWILEDYGEINDSFGQLLKSENFITLLEPMGEKFFYRVAFVAPIGEENDILSQKVYDYLIENARSEVAEALGGVAVNFVGGAYGSPG